MDYATLKITHLSCVAISYALFVLRGIWMMRDFTLLRLGMIALRRGKTRAARIAAWIAAQAVFFYIVAVALRHNPWPWAD